MKFLNEKLQLVREHDRAGQIKVMIVGLGSVGNYLLDYLMSLGDPKLKLIVVGRNRDKLLSDANIVRVASLIRGQNRSEVTVVSDVDFNSVDALAACFKEHKPDFIVNSSRAYSGLKYGSISWKNVRAYGIWSPLSIKYIKNIMAAYEKAQSSAIVINTSYSDAVIPWMKSAGVAYPDFGSGNLNHLIPRIRFAVAKQCKIEDYWNIDVTYATAHFHDVVISKEGQTEGVDQLIHIEYRGKKLEPDMDAVFAACKIEMPVDAKRNMMNASSNFEIITGILNALRQNKAVKLHCPGVFGELGGYPVIIDGTGSAPKAYIDESKFSLAEMREHNAKSLYLDGIEAVKDGELIYTDELIEKVRLRFGANLVKRVPYQKTDEVAGFLITEIIEKFKGE